MSEISVFEILTVYGLPLFLQFKIPQVLSLMFSILFIDLEADTFPVGIQCQNDVVSTSMRRHDVTSTLKQHHFLSCACCV